MRAFSFIFNSLLCFQSLQLLISAYLYLFFCTVRYSIAVPIMWVLYRFESPACYLVSDVRARKIGAEFGLYPSLA